MEGVSVLLSWLTHAVSAPPPPNITTTTTTTVTPSDDHYHHHHHHLQHHHHHTHLHPSLGTPQPPPPPQPTPSSHTHRTPPYPGGTGGNGVSAEVLHCIAAVLWNTPHNITELITDDLFRCDLVVSYVVVSAMRKDTDTSLTN